MKKEDYLKKMSDCVFEFEDEEIKEICKDYIKDGYEAVDAVMGGLVDGMRRAGDLFAKDEYFVTDLLLCSDAMYNGLEILKPHIDKKEEEKKVKCVIGVIEGDTHDIGKNLVKTMMEAQGFEMYDLGRDVKVEDFVVKAEEINADIIALSTLMTTTMDGMRRVIEKLKEEGLRDKFKVLIGGGPVSQKFSESIEADGYSKDAIEAVKLAKKVMDIKE